MLFLLVHNEGLASHPHVLLLPSAEDLPPQLGCRTFNLLYRNIQLRPYLILVLLRQNLVLILPSMQRIQALEVVVLLLTVVERVAQLGFLRLGVKSLMVKVVAFQMRR